MKYPFSVGLLEIVFKTKHNITVKKPVNSVKIENIRQDTCYPSFLLRYVYTCTLDDEEKLEDTGGKS